MNEENRYKYIIINLKKTFSFSDLEYIFKINGIQKYQSIEAHYEYDITEFLDDFSSDDQVNDKIKEFSKKYDKYFMLYKSVLEERNSYTSLIYDARKNKDYSEYEIQIHASKDPYELINIINKIQLLDDQELFYGDMYLESQGSSPTLLELTSIYPNQNTYSTFGFNIHWWFIIPPKGHKERPIDPFESDDIFLNAPVHKAQRLKSGATLIQITENYDFLNPDNQEYIDTLLKFNEYLKNNMKK